MNNQLELMQQTQQIQQQAEQMLIQYVHCAIPVMTKEKMACSIGLSITRIHAMLRNGILPSYDMGNLQLVNLAKLFIQRDLLPSVLVGNPTASEINSQLLEGTPKQVVPFLLPVTTKARFADLVGTSPPAVQGWINRGYVPTVKDGKYRLIDLMALFSECISINNKLVYRIHGLSN